MMALVLEYRLHNSLLFQPTRKIPGRYDTRALPNLYAQPHPADHFLNSK